MEFRLLIETSESQSQPSLFLAGRHWILSLPYDLENEEQLPSFACISYLWGTGREPHATAEGLTMSTRTRPSLAAAIRIGNCNAFWIDVLCVPPAGPERQSTLENMGYIYSRATEVIIVLSDGTFSIIQEIVHKGFISESGLQILEIDEWVSSVWTYQEIVNSGLVRFVSEREADTFASVECLKFLNALGYSLSKWERSAGSDGFAVMKRFPNLNALMDICADWQMAAYTFRSAFSIFSSIASKRNADPANYFYAILGTLTQSTQQIVWDPGQNLAEKVMTICEQKNDFSFIYTVAARDTDLRKRWRPRAVPLPADGATVPATLRPILAWHCYGEAQRGHYDATGFWLHGMTIMQAVSSIDGIGRKAISSWLHKPELQHMDNATVVSAVHSIIASNGFNEKAGSTIVAKGIVFTIETVRRNDIVRILVTNQIRWVMGAPALVHVGQGDEKQYMPGAFLGSTEGLLGDGESVLL